MEGWCGGQKREMGVNRGGQGGVREGGGKEEGRIGAGAIWRKEGCGRPTGWCSSGSGRRASYSGPHAFSRSTGCDDSLILLLSVSGLFLKRVVTTRIRLMTLRGETRACPCPLPRSGAIMPSRPVIPLHIRNSTGSKLDYSSSFVLHTKTSAIHVGKKA